MAQYGEVRVDYITYTTGTVPTEANATVTVSSLVNDPVFSGDVQVGGNVTITGNLNVSGDSLFDAITVSGNSILNTLTVTGGSNLEDVEISGTLTVTGNTELNTLTVNGNTNLNTLTATGAANLESLEVSGGLTVTGNSSFNSLTVTGSTTLNTLTVTGNTNLEDLEVSGTLTVTGDTNLNTLTVTGATNLESLEVSGGLTVTGSTTLNTLTVTGDTNLNTLTVTGNSNLEDVEISGTLTVTGNTFVSGNLTVQGDLNASGVTISGFTGLFASGTETEPSISFAADPNTGIYNKSGDSIAITTNGSDKLEITSNTASFFQDAAAVNFDFNVAAGTLIGNKNTTVLPPVNASNQGGAYFSWNKSQGSAEVNIYNPYVGPTGRGADASFVFEQMTSGTGGVYDSLEILGLSQYQTQAYVSGIRLFNLTSDGLAVGNLASTGVGDTNDDLDIQSVNPTLRFTDKNQNAYSRIVYDGNLSTLFIESDRGDNEADSKIQFSNDNTPQAFLATSGQFLLKNTYTIREDFYDKTFGARFQIEGDDHGSASAGIVRNSNTPGGGWLQFGKSRGTTDGDITIVQSGDTLGGVTFGGADGYGLLQGINVMARVSDTPASGHIPADLRVETFTSGVVSNRVIVSSGGVTIDSKEVVTEADIGTGPNQIPMNWMLGKDAYSSSKSVDTGFTFLRLGAVTPGSQYVRPLGNGYINCYYSVIQGRCFVEINSNAGVSAADKTAYLALEGAAEEDIIVVAGLPLLTLQQNTGTSHRGGIEYTYLSMVINGYNTTTNAVMFSNGHNLGNTGPVLDSEGDTWWMNTKFVPVVGPTYPRGLPPLINTAEINTNFREPVNGNNQTAYNGWNSYFFIKPIASAPGGSPLAELRIRDLWGEGQTGDTRTFDARMYGSYQVE